MQPNCGVIWKSMFSFIRNCQTVFQSAFPPATSDSFCCFALRPAAGIVLWLDFSHSDKGIVVSHCFNLHFPDVKWYRSSFHMLISHLCIFFDDVSNCLVRGAWVPWSFFFCRAVFSWGFVCHSQACIEESYKKQLHETCWWIYSRGVVEVIDRSLCERQHEKAF